MPTQGITFGGQYIYLPGAYYQDNVSAAAPVTPPTTPPLLFIGYGWGPKPLTPQTYTSPQALLAALRGSPASAFVQFFANPSPALNGAQLVTFIDASTNTQASAAILTSGGTSFANLTSALYGPPSNQIQYQVSAASVSGRKLTLLANYSGTELVGDNLGAPFEIAYAGAATGSVSYSVTSGATSGTFSLTSPVAGESYTLNTGSGAYATVSQLVTAINANPNTLANLLSATNGTLPANLLSPVSSGGLVTGSVYAAVHAYQNDMLWWVNNFAYTIATAVSGAGSTDTIASNPATTTFTYFSGATGGIPTSGGYASALNIGLSQPAWVVLCDNNTVGVQALLAQHCELASSAPYGMWRRGVTGSSIGDSVATTETNATNLDSLQMSYAYPGIYAVSTLTNTLQLYGGLYVAAAAAGIMCGNQIALPLTNKVLNGTGVETPGGSALTTSQLSALQNNGVMAVYVPQQSQVPTILSDVTTWQVDSNIENTSSQQVACRYWLAYSVVNVLSQYIGTIATPTQEADILKDVTILLNSLINTGTGSNGVLVSWVPGSLNLTYTGSNQLAAITFQAVLVGQNRFVTCYASIQPLNFSISATAQGS